MKKFLNSMYYFHNKEKSKSQMRNKGSRDHLNSDHNTTKYRPLNFFFL